MGKHPQITISFVVHGHPEPAGSKKAFARRAKSGKMISTVVDANPKAKSWKNRVAQVAGEIHKGELLEGPLCVYFRFFRMRPKNHFRTNGELKPWAVNEHPTQKPDALKLARAVEDALSGVIYRDDSQIVYEVLSKEYGDSEKVSIIVFPAGNPPDDDMPPFIRVGPTVTRPVFTITEED